jgi:gas vesicle protein
MARFTDFLAGCVVGGAILATGVVLARRNGEDLRVSMLKDDSTAVVWAVNRTTGKARFVSWSSVPLQASRDMAREGARRLGEMWAAGGPIAAATDDFFGGIAEGALRAKGINAPAGVKVSFPGQPAR